MNDEKKPEILIVDDDPNLRRLIRHHLRGENYNIGEACDGRAALACLEIEPLSDLILLDQNMPELNGIDTLHNIRANPYWDHIFVLMLTSEERLDFQRRVLREGAGDFIIKPHDAEILRARIRNGLAMVHVRRESGVDYMTGVNNRRTFEKILALEQSRIQRFGHPVALIMVDIDHFKKVNDTYGHPVGDLILRDFATLLGTCLRQVDLLARFGGEEFVIILPETELSSATAVAEKLCSRVAGHEFPVQGRLTASFGVAACHSNTEVALKEVDAALYSAKKGGRNQVHTAPGLINSHY